MEHLNVTGQPFNDTTIQKYEFHNYQPYISGNIGYNDEIRIPIQDLDAYTLPCNSYIEIVGKLGKVGGGVPTKLKFINNGIAFLFRELRYELNGILIDSVRNVGLVSTLKNYVSINRNESIALENSGWFKDTEEKTGTNTTTRKTIIVDRQGNFNVCIPLRLLSGFFEDFQKIIVNVKQELVLIRSSHDKDAVISADDTEEPKIEITKLSWCVPHIIPSLSQQVRLNTITAKGTELPIKFRSWELVEYPALPESARHTWTVKTSNKVETPRHVLIAFQKNKRSNVKEDMSRFDHCNLRNVKIFLNTERYPYGDLNLDFKNNVSAKLYEMYSNFRESYYHLKSNEPMLSPSEFVSLAPIVHIDCSRQREIVQPGSILLRVEFETQDATTSDVSAYCLIIHEKDFSYNPLTKVVQQY